jgi:hypothetical protein
MRHLRVSAVLAAILLAGCSSSEPKAVQATNPTITFQYRGDDELIRANQSAADYCAQYRSVPQTSRFEDSRDGRTVIFECTPTASDVPRTRVRGYDPDIPYGYRGDQDLMDAAHDAQLYCREHYQARAVSAVWVAPDGTKTTSYRCAS